ncbi:MAG: hypothetical protein A3E82_07500 [Gammaproteobacteria bacterium RIFCSPHIGHO2_12_FULL_38_11]|nr:MAG: hypothetical protein A3E82_07500 [Gammaproteobacteria bacterium RIFCSPHIGHO2_12_FULL_38_11]
MSRKNQPGFKTLLADSLQTAVFDGAMGGIGVAIIPASMLMGYVRLLELLEHSLKKSLEPRTASALTGVVAFITTPVMLLPAMATQGAFIGGATLGAVFLTLPFAITAQLTRKFQENAEFESAIRYLENVEDRETKKAIIKEIIAHDKNSPIGIRSVASLELRSKLYSGNWEALLEYMRDKTADGVYRNNGKKLFHAVQASETLIAGYTGIERKDAELRERLQSLTEKSVRLTFAEYQDALQFIFNFLFNATEKDIRRCDLDFIFRSKDNLKSELKSYIATLDLQQLQLLSDPKNMLGKLIDYQTAILLKTKHTGTRHYVNSLIAAKKAQESDNIPVATVVTTASPVAGVPILTEEKLIIVLDGAIDKLKKSEFDYLGKKARQQKRLVLEAAKSVLNNIISDDEFVKVLSDNPEYTHTFKPGKEAETVRLVRQLLALKPSLKQKLQAEIARLEKAHSAKKAASFFNRKDPVLSALEAINVPTALFPVNTTQQALCCA